MIDTASVPPPTRLAGSKLNARCCLALVIGLMAYIDELPAS
jgi:hypothetical protein